MNALMEMKNINKSFGSNRVLENVNVSLYSGEVLALLGENGAGKSTLMKVLSGIHEPTKGTITINNINYNKLDHKLAAQLGIGIIYQELSVIDELTVLENLYIGRHLTKKICGVNMIDWKEMLVAAHAPATVNSMLAAVNSFLAFMGWRELRVRPLRIQRTLFRDAEKELTRTEYARLVKAADRLGNERLCLVLQTLCATGIRVSELRFITAAAVETGRTEVVNKGKRRTVFLPDQLRKLLRKYLRRQKKTAGAVFTTRTGNPLDRSNIWRDMKSLCKQADVPPKKVFPHNLRHLFARTFYSVEKDIVRLADLLGHSSINTTRIYTMETGEQHLNRLEKVQKILIFT